MKRFLTVILMLAIVCITVVGCATNYANDYKIAKVVIHPSIISSLMPSLDSKDEINSFFGEFKILDADFKHTVSDDFDPESEHFVGGNAAEIQVETNDGNDLLFYVTKDGTVYRVSADETVYTDPGAINYNEMIAFLDK